MESTADGATVMLGAMPLFAERTVIVGHRGSGAGNQQLTENTLPSFLAAYEAGARWVELDARRSANGELVVHHDELLADGRAVPELEVAQLREAGVWSLADLLAELPADLGVNIECKPVLADALRRPEETTAGMLGPLVAQATSDRDCVVSCFDPAAVRILAESAPRVPTGLIFMPFVQLSAAIPAAVHLGCAAVGVRTSALRPGGVPEPLANPAEPPVAEAVAVAHEAGLAVVSWVVEPADVPALATAGLDALVVDDVPGALAALAGG